MSIDKKYVLTGLVASSIMLHTGMTTAFADTEYGVITADAVNFRSGPSTSYSSIGKFNKGDKVEYLGESGSWIKVKYSNKTGYVYGEYVEKYSSSITKYVNTTSLNFRSGPSTSYSIIGKLSSGTKVEVISTSNGWSKIKYDGKTGYVSSKYLSISAPESSNTTTKYVNTTSLNFRSGPSTSYSVIGKLSSGTKVEVLSTSNGWSKIKYDGKTGYVSSEYLSSSAPESSNTTTKYVNTSTLNVRSGPSTSYSVIGTLSSGTKIGVISTSNGWSKIKYNNKTGYVSSEYLSSNAPDDSNSTSSSVSKVISIAKTLLGKSYVWGAQGPSSFDCSGFTYYVLKNATNISLPRVSKDQSKYGTYVSKSNLKAGDLIFFDTSGPNNGNVSHVGIYLGNNEFIHASSSKGKVVISQMSSYYNAAFVNARRVL
ncbi:SH3 domain-containing protein [Terrisporobacter petrolearius]|uniref:C40 family peptidase n=1 Tax=Terrisporobacter petrolearius TaxID=1460447 RepID=UPI001D166BA1|nr:SH3 domain-containing protein [Terrisporobacter petrolearius]MCC3863260.1 SH3 domain-containing protein [Terrisporobacter petrolearius]